MRDETVEERLQVTIDETIYNDFLNRINIIVQNYLSIHAGTKYYQFSEDKVINDPIWGVCKIL